MFVPFNAGALASFLLLDAKLGHSLKSELVRSAVHPHLHLTPLVKIETKTKTNFDRKMDMEKQ